MSKRRNGALERAAQNVVTTARLLVGVLRTAEVVEGTGKAIAAVADALTVSVNALDAALSPEEPPRRGRPPGSRNRVVETADGTKEE